MKKRLAANLHSWDEVRIKKTGEVGRVSRVEVSGQVVMIFVIVKTLNGQDQLLGLTHLEVE